MFLSCKDQKKISQHSWSNVERCSNRFWIAYPLRIILVGSLCAWLLIPIGCGPHERAGSAQLVPSCVGVDLSNPAMPVILPDGIRLSVAKNAWTQFVVQLNGSTSQGQLRLPRLQHGIVFTAYQILSVPVDSNEAEYVRMVGDSKLPAIEPRVLLPLPMSGDSVDLSKLKNPHEPVLIWIDAHIAVDVIPGNYQGDIQFDGSAVAHLPLRLTVENLTLPSGLHLHIAAPLDWSVLSRQYPDVFEQIPPRLLVRGDARSAKVIELIESYLRLAHENNADFFLPQLQPIVKWPLGKGPEIDWGDFDSVVGPWLSGSGFADGRSIGFWPVPGTDMLDQFKHVTSAQYWQAAADHFAKEHWTLLPQAGTVYDDASQRVGSSVRFDPTADSSSAGFTEQSMRMVGWRAFADDSSLILCDAPLPQMGQSTAAHKIVWAYPGESFGEDQPLSTVVLKWLRQAEQDYEYLLLSKQHNPETPKICRLVTPPLQGDRAQQPLLNQFAALSDAHACERARQVLVSQLVRGANGAGVDAMQLATIRWFAELEKQTVVPTSVDWKWDLKDSRIAATLRVLIYNSAARMEQGGHVQWVGGENGWDVSSADTAVGPIDRFHAATQSLVAQFDPAVVSTLNEAVEIQYTDDFSRQTASCRAALPVAVSQRRHEPLVVDGNLSDWYPADAIALNRPLVKMFSQRSVQAGTLEVSATPSSIYSGWSEDNFYMAFRLGGVVASDLRSTRNFVQYDQGRAWGEDLCELLIQPIYIDNYVGPLLHVVCKPGGSWVEQQAADLGWQPFEASGLRYASGVDPAQKVWRGEVALPWKAINAAGHGRPALLRFNFIQHKQENGESASWAGPIDQSRDGKLSGLLLIKE